MPNILNGIKLITIENDFQTIEEKDEVGAKLLSAGFESVYCEPFLGVPIAFPCLHQFYEVWQRFRM